jgi:hypothetical protein
MASVEVFCDNCSSTLRVPLTNANASYTCPSLGCGQTGYLYVFPALFRPPEAPNKGENVLVEGESTCFYHSGKVAAVACDQCGRFLCSLCDIDMGHQHLCATCIESGTSREEHHALPPSTLYYDELSLLIAILPVCSLFMVWVTCLTAPLALGLAVVGWNKQRTVMPRGKWRFVLAGTASILEIIAWCVLMVYLISGKPL